MKGDKEVIDMVNRRRNCVKIVNRIERDLDCFILARNLNAISARRRKNQKS